MYEVAGVRGWLRGEVVDHGEDKDEEKKSGRQSRRAKKRK